MAADESRPLTDYESAVIERLLSDHEFPGRAELIAQLPGLTGVTIDSDGGVALRPTSGPSAPVVGRVPVEGRAESADGVGVNVLLHVVDGRLAELEWYRDDGAEIEVHPAVNEIMVEPWISWLDG